MDFGSDYCEYREENEGSMDFSHIKEHVAPKVIEVFGVNISESVFYAICVSLILIAAAAIIRIFYIPKFSLVPKRFQALLETAVRFFENLASDSGHIAKFLGPYIFGVGLFIGFGILFEMFGFRSPIADINTAFALSLMTFVLINFFGVQKHGPIGRIKYFFKPTAIVGPFRIMSDLMVPVSMTFRLFGSVLSGMIAMEIVYAMLPVALPVIAAPVFTLFHAIIQPYIFTMLTVLFVSEAAE